MPKQIFVNLPVKDLIKSMEFFSKLGFTFNKQFTDEKAASMVISDTIYCMLLKEEFFKTFTRKDLVDAHKSTEGIFALTVESREEVDRMFNLVLEAGGKESRPTEDHGWMYARAFEDLDGHIWEFFWMDPANIQSN